MSGVKWYAVANVDIYFAEGKVCCDYCPLLETYARKQCRKTGEYISVDTRVTTGFLCPLNFEIKEDENVQNAQGA